MECCKKWFFKVKLKIRKYDTFFVLRIQKIIHIQFFNDIYIYTFIINSIYTNSQLLNQKKKKKDKKCGEKKSKKINE